MSAFLGPIHMWLYNQIQIVEKREAAIAAALMEKYDDRDLLLDIYAAQAAELAEKAKVRDNVDKFNLDDAFEIINEHFVERMPCDRLSGAVKEEEKIIWKHQSRLHQEFWQQTGVSWS